MPEKRKKEGKGMEISIWWVVALTVALTFSIWRCWIEYRFGREMDDLATEMLREIDSLREEVGRK